MTGSVAYPLLHQWAKGREKELETIFLAEKDQKAIGSRWLYNQKGAGGWPGDLGYWIGYRVAKSYYDRAPDKTAAIILCRCLIRPYPSLGRYGHLRSEAHTSELQ